MKEIIFSIEKNDINTAYFDIINNRSRIVHLYGGAGSGKSVFAAQKLVVRMLSEIGHKILLVRKVARTIRASQYSLLKSLIQNSGANSYFSFKDVEMTITCLLNGNEFITAGMDDREKIKSIHGVTAIWIEEATELERKDFTQINLRLRGNTKNYKQIILTYNPVNANHWLNKINMQNSVRLKTTYKDNKFIDEEYKKVLEDLKFEDEEYYNIYTLGEWGTLKNIIFKPFEISGDFPPEFDEIIYGLDFGFNNKTALVEIGIRDNIFYLNELIYESRLTNADLISRMKELGIKYNNYIYCDSSEPNRIEEIRRAGFNSHPAEKSVKDGIDFLKRCKIFSKADNAGINAEVLSYSYKQDKDGNVLDEPVKFNDHGMDAVRYAIYSHSKNARTFQVKWI